MNVNLNLLGENMVNKFCMKCNQITTHSDYVKNWSGYQYHYVSCQKCGKEVLVDKKQIPENIQKYYK